MRIVVPSGGDQWGDVGKRPEGARHIVVLDVIGCTVIGDPIEQGRCAGAFHSASETVCDDPIGDAGQMGDP